MRYCCLLVITVCLSAAACQRDSARRGVQSSGGAKVTAPVIEPAATLDTGPLVPHPDALETPTLTIPPTRDLRSRGKVGDVLSGDVFTFQVKSIRACKDAAPETAPGNKLVGIEVEIQTKASMNISPRDVLMKSGGIILYADLTQKRGLKGCAPRLTHVIKKAKERATGFVVFEMPDPDLPNIEIHYQPTRFGGSSSVTVQLGQCLLCGDKPSKPQ